MIKYEFDESEGVESEKDASRIEGIEVKRAFIHRAKSFAVKP